MNLLTETELYAILSETLPKQNDFGESDYSEELQELFDFGIETREQLLELIAKHREEVLAIDSEDMDEFQTKWFVDLYGAEYVNHRVENKFWYAYAGLLRIILELEFEDDYREYAEERDGVNDEDENENEEGDQSGNN